MAAALVERSEPVDDTIRRIAVKVGSTVIDERFDVQWQEIGSDIGSGKFSLLNSDSQNSICTIGSTVSFELDGGAVFRWILDDIDRTPLTEDEEVAEITVYSGRSMGAILDDVIVYPAKGVYEVTTPPFLAGLRLTTKPYSADRYLGWMDPNYDDSSWGSAVEVLTPSGPFRPEGMPTGSAARWIWHEAATSGAHAASVGLFRKTFSTSPTTVFAVKTFLAGLEGVEAYLDGAVICRTDPALDTDVGQAARSATIEVNGAMTHTIAVRVPHADASGLGGLLAALFEHDTATVITDTGSDWKAINEADVPDMNPGSVMIQLVDEGFARGCLPDITFSFTDTTDSSAALPFPSILGGFACRVGDTLLDVLRQLGEQYVEWTFETGGGGQLLAMWTAAGVDTTGGTGVGRGSASGVTFAEGVNCTELHHKVTGNMKTVVLGLWADGFIEGPVFDAITANGRRESFLSISNVTSGPSALQTMFATIVPISTPETSIVVAIAPENTADEPYLAFNIGDTVTCPNAAGVDTEYRVVAISCQEDEDGQLTWFPELATLRDVFEQRQQRWLRRTANGTIDGRSHAASITSPSVTKAGKVNVIEISVSSGGAGEVLIGDRGTPFTPREKLLVYALKMKSDVAGATSATTLELLVDGAGTGERVSNLVTADEGYHDIAAPFIVGPLNVVNFEATAEGGHTGVTAVALAVPTQ